MKSAAEEKFLALLRKPIKTKEEILEKENARLAFEKELSLDEEELTRELNSVGFKVTSAWDLVNTKNSYPKAIQVLIKHLSKNYHYKNKEGIVRALSVKEAIGKASQALMEEYNRTPKEQEAYRWAIGNSVFTTITSNDVEGVIKIVKNKSNGQSRQMFVLALGKVQSEKAEDALIDLLNDEEMVQYALEALCKLKSRKAKDKIGKLLNHPKLLIRKEAKNALKKIS